MILGIIVIIFFLGGGGGGGGAEEVYGLSHCRRDKTLLPG